MRVLKIVQSNHNDALLKCMKLLRITERINCECSNIFFSRSSKSHGSKNGNFKQIKQVSYVRELRKFKLLSNEISFTNVSNSDICNPCTKICTQ